MTILNDIKHELALVCAVEPRHVSEEGRLIEYGLDSVRCMDLIIALEERFAVEIPDGELAGLKTVRDVVSLIAGKLKNACDLAQV